MTGKSLECLYQFVNGEMSLHVYVYIYVYMYIHLSDATITNLLGGDLGFEFPTANQQEGTHGFGSSPAKVEQLSPNTWCGSMSVDVHSSL